MAAPRPTSMSRLSERFLARRRALHSAYAALSGLPDASRLAYLHGPEQRWTEAEVADMWRRARPTLDGARQPANHLYVHVPFCKSICSFCNYERLRPSHPALLRSYVDRVKRSIETLGPAVEHLTFHTLYIGGGTPSVLPTGLLAELVDAIHSGFDFHPRAGHRFEFDPAVMTAERFDVLEQRAPFHYSFGVQTLDASVNLAHGRGAQSHQLVARRFAEMEARGIREVSVDFLMGLAGTTPARLFADIETVLEQHGPHSVDIFMLTPTHDYVGSHFGGSFEAFWDHIRPFEAQVGPWMQRVAARHGYRVQVGQGHHLVLSRKAHTRRGRDTGAFSYTQLASEQDQPINLLGLGPSARAHIWGQAILQTQNPPEGARPDAPAVYSGSAMTMADEQRTYLAHHLRDRDDVDRTVLQEIFGHDIAELAPVAVAGWQADGVASLDESALVFAPQARRERTRSLLWLVPDAALEHAVARHHGIDLRAETLRHCIRPLREGSPLHGGITLGSISFGRYTLMLPGGEALGIRAAPVLDDDRSPPRLIVEGALPASLHDAARKSVLRLTALVRRNHPVLAHAAQRSPAPSPRHGEG